MPQTDEQKFERKLERVIENQLEDLFYQLSNETEDRALVHKMLSRYEDLREYFDQWHLEENE